MMKFLGFYRLLQKPPAPVIPLFTDGIKTYRQLSDEQDVVLEYIELQEYEEDRIFISNEMKFAPPPIGESAIYAYEYHDGAVAVGDATSIKTRLRRIVLNDAANYKNSFAKLEIAQFLDDEEMVLKFAYACASVLEKTSSDLSKAWLDGAPLPQGTKSAVRDKIDQKSRKNEELVTVKFSMRKLVQAAIKKNAETLGKTLDQYITESIERSVQSKEFHSNTYSKKNIEYVKNKIHSDTSSIFKSFFDTVTIITDEVRRIAEFDKKLDMALFDFFVADAMRDRFELNLSSFKVEIKKEIMDKALEMIRSKDRLNDTSRGVFIVMSVSQRDTEFFSKVHSDIKQKSDRAVKTYSRIADTYYKKFKIYVEAIS